MPLDELAVVLCPNPCSHSPGWWVLWWRLRPRSTPPNAPNGVDLTLTAELTAPAPGLIITFGHVDVFSNKDEVYSCWTEISDQQVAGSLSNSPLDGDSSVNLRESCSSRGHPTKETEGEHNACRLKGSLQHFGEFLGW